jgi:hypothetical protein
MATKMAVEVGRGEYKGHPLLVFGKGLRFPFQFGIGKAKLLLSVIDDLGPDGFKKLLSDFVAENAGAGDE